MSAEVSEFKAWERFHRKFVIAIAVCTVCASAFTITAPVVLTTLAPDAQLVPWFLGMAVPQRVQPIMLVLLGLVMLCEGIFLFYLHPAGWWIAVATSGIGVVDCLVSFRGAWFHTLLDVALLLYLFHIRRMFLRS